MGCSGRTSRTVMPAPDKLLILDLDETLIYATEEPLDRESDFRVGPYYVYQRPHLEQFVTTCLGWFEVAVWTSSTRAYAIPVIEAIFPDPAALAFVWTSDRCSLAFDHELLELTARIPSRWKVNGGVTKWVLKEAYRDRLPATILSRPKQGFEVPVDEWIRGPLRERFQEGVLGSGSRLEGLIDPDVASQMFREHQRGVARHGRSLWALLVLSAWAGRYLGRTQRAAA